MLNIMCAEFSATYIFWLMLVNCSEERIRNGAKKLGKAKSSSTQGRLDTFFKVLPTIATTKRKVHHARALLIVF